ncbi:Amino acid ABC transporter ATPase (modular protein) [Frankia canadensis]|uniref:Amino acid ABC transporter ATPase (Modular protein) n=1 Tax=Frankia canadensis TaxID=1836972 RepID=A0A2I2KM17_9ACTN|nr:ATP-binding cassette domain-containing protein [Frankia canadensis]SNQ46708.1 Amino acid ABC transporter ATPase (modular protein) [Frankia canadensis]SOU53998.1 Amino acid ABC transporter ATPase (modular protein) [Frankia canadensis]
MSDHSTPATRATASETPRAGTGAFTTAEPGTATAGTAATGTAAGTEIAGTAAGTAASEPALSARGLRLGYGDLTAVWDMDVDVYAGRTTALLGRNGAGKTTLLSGLVGLLGARAGSVRLHGVDVTRLPPWTRVQRGLGIVQEGKRVFRNLTVTENISVALHATVGRSGRAEALERTWANFPVLADRRRRLGGELSGGQQQMLSIATAMVAQPSVLLIDEPSSGLAPLAVEQVLQIIDGLKAQGLAILLVEQIVEEVLSGYADAVILVDQGRSVLSQPADQVSVEQITAAMFGTTAWAS